MLGSRAEEDTISLMVYSECSLYRGQFRPRYLDYQQPRRRLVGQEKMQDDLSAEYYQIVVLEEIQGFAIIFSREIDGSMRASRNWKITEIWLFWYYEEDATFCGYGA